MARSTRLFVRAFERKARLVVVIKVDGLPLDLGTVTERALFLTEQRLTVDVLVTRRAVHRPVGQSEHRARVAAVAWNARVLGLDREARVLVVIKLRRIERAPVLRVVAALAVGDLFVKLSVWRLVTTDAGHRCEQEARASRLGLLLVTVFAVHHRVTTLKRKARRGVVVELLLAAHRDPAKQVRVESSVFFVTEHAGTTERFGRRVQTDLLLNAIRDRLVALETLFVIDLAPACRVTFDAVGGSVDFGVTLGELSRR